MKFVVTNRLGGEREVEVKLHWSTKGKIRKAALYGACVAAVVIAIKYKKGSK